jgi:hypothetical protein
MRVRSLRQQALADEAHELVVSSPKDKNFQSLPWDALKEREQQEFFSPTATPNSEGPNTPTSAEYGQLQDRITQPLRPTPASNIGKSHRRTMSTPVLSSDSNTSASRKPSLLKRRPMPISESGRSPLTKSFPTINEPLCKPDVEKPIPPELKPEYKAPFCHSEPCQNSEHPSLELSHEDGWSAMHTLRLRFRYPASKAGCGEKSDSTFQCGAMDVFSSRS